MAVLGLVIFIVWFVYIVLLGLLQAGCRNRGCKLIFGFGVWLAAAMMVFGLGSILGTDPFTFYSAPPTWKSAIRQIWKSALQRSIAARTKASSF
jgi:hypothetical protein